MELAGTELTEKPNRRVRIRKYVIYALVAVACAILLYVFIWFGTQLGLQN